MREYDGKRGGRDGREGEVYEKRRVVFDLNSTMGLC
jgi:hypothetical protein